MQADRIPVTGSYNAVIPFLIPSAPVRSGVVLALRARAAAVVDSNNGRSCRRLKRFGRGIDIDLMPRLEMELTINRRARKIGGINSRHFEDETLVIMAAYFMSTGQKDRGCIR